MRAAAYLAGVLAGATAGAAERIDIEPVWSAHPVGFCLLTHPPHQFAAYYDAERRMTVAQRRLDTNVWTFTRLPSTLGWDSHNYATLAVDREGFLHLSGNMHCVPLVYFRSANPLDAASLVRELAMTGEREQKVTYPVFLRDKANRLVFRYRDGSSGSGDDLYNAYDEETKTWRRLMGGPLLSGLGDMNAYCTVPKKGPDGRFHAVWVWRETGDCATTRDLSYARSDDLEHWTDSAGIPLALPITPKTCEIVDPVPPGGGLLNVNRQLGFDHAGRPVLSYHKYDKKGDLQAFVARREAAGWNIVQVSDWKGYRWDFRGGGTIIVEVTIGEVRAVEGGRLAMSYRRGRDAGEWVLDEATLKPVPGLKAPPSGTQPPREFARIESPFPGMERQGTNDIGTPPAGSRFELVWETLPANRDRPRAPPLPAPTMLRMIRYETPARPTPK